MNGVRDKKVWFLREGLFAKYVVSLVGLVVFVLAVNGAMETWIGYRATRSALTDAMASSLGGSLRVGMPAERIEFSQGRWRVFTPGGAPTKASRIGPV